MSLQKHIALDCPYCKESIYESMAWFKKTYSTCPFCENGLSASQFAKAISELETAMDESIEEMLLGRPQAGGCCGKKSSCGCGV